MNEFVGTITSSPGPISSARSASEIASVPEETPTAYAGPAVGGELGLEGLELGAHREGARAGDALDDLEQLLEQDRVGLVEAGDRDRARSGAFDGGHAATFRRSWARTPSR